MADKENNQSEQDGPLNGPQNETKNGSGQPKRKADDDVVGKVYDAQLMRRLGHFVRPYWLQAGIASFSVSLKSLCDVAGPILVMVAVDRYLDPEASDQDPSNAVAHWVATNSPLAHVLPQGAVQGVTRLAAIYLAMLVSAYLLQFIQVYLMQWIGQKIMFDLRRDIFRHMQRMDVAFFDVHPVGRLVTRLTSDVDAVNDMFTEGVLAIVNDAFLLIIMAIVMLAISWWLALLAFAVLPIILVVTRIFRDHVRESYRRVRTAIARINSFTQEHISGMSVVQLFNREDRAYKDFEDVNRQHMIAFKDTIFAYALYYPAVDFLSSVAIALVVWRGGFGVLHLPPTVTIGVLFMFTQYSLRFWRPIQDLSDKYNILQAAMAACERIFKLMDSQPAIVSPAHPIPGDGSNRIEFEHVWFTYQKLTDEQKAAVAAAQRNVTPASWPAVPAASSPAPYQTHPESHEVSGHDFSRAASLAGNDRALAPEGTPDAAALAAIPGIEWILKDVSFTIEPGQTVAIVGHTGAGKTTLTSLMMRFYEVTAGRILLDGVDLREHDLTELRKHFAVVLQDPFLFSGTIGENIRLGNEQIDDQTMRRAARDVNVLDFIETLPHGFDEPVRERGNSLSTGQKQLINFARALAYNPHILILDEATSSVDTDTELRIRGALERLVEGRTSVLIAHRLSTVQRAETILVMHKGQLREMGSHQELLAHRGLYWKLYQLQYKDQENGLLAPPSAEPSTAQAV
jgi:ATP-binding cassette, subfamily B, multidrug efflux pump